MTVYDAIRLAREAGIIADEHAGHYLPPECMQRFAALVAAAEREACAKAAERCLVGPAARNMARTIRERGQQ